MPMDEQEQQELFAHEAQVQELLAALEAERDGLAKEVKRLRAEQDKAADHTETAITRTLDDMDTDGTRLDTLTTADFAGRLMDAIRDEVARG